MTLQHWAFSFKGRIGRRDFWAGLGTCFALFLCLSIINDRIYPLPAIVTWILIFFILYPLCAIFTKRLHDRNKRGIWLLLLLLAVMLGLADTSSLEPFWQWAMGRFLPSFIGMIMLLDCGVFVGNDGENYFGKQTEQVDYRRWR
ncbi:DUF805 domain-containing protein [Proteus hauseri]|uniref:DUF805 domain-containing protein n=1 Tax=Proteus cibi TaxID=2050966 RepID=UPI0003C58E95|nr:MULTISPECIES: DUF805 domain-containing protein [Proteus]EST57258.1 hypothetical protein K151_3064 [Proteus hauseri ZMd44]MBG6031062.1 DUF805 domain-containing protein [Proteus hauseri]